MIDPFRLITRDGTQIDGAELRRLAEAVRRLELMYLAPRAQSITTPGGPVLFTRGLGGGQLQVQVNGDTPRPFEPLWNLVPRNGLVIAAVDNPALKRVDITFTPMACAIPVPTAVCPLGSGGIRMQFQRYDLSRCAFVGSPWCVDFGASDCCGGSGSGPPAFYNGCCGGWPVPDSLCLDLSSSGFPMFPSPIMIPLTRCILGTSPSGWFGSVLLPADCPFLAPGFLQPFNAGVWQLAAWLGCLTNPATGQSAWQLQLAVDPYNSSTCGAANQGLASTGGCGWFTTYDLATGSCDPLNVQFVANDGWALSCNPQSVATMPPRCLPSGPAAAATVRSGVPCGAGGGGGGGGCPDDAVFVPCTPVCMPRTLTVRLVNQTGCPVIDGATLTVTWTGTTWTGSGTLNGVAVNVSVQCGSNVTAGFLTIIMTTAFGSFEQELAVTGPPFAGVGHNNGSFGYLGICPNAALITINVS